ncbi:MAG: MATE family efflux transporter [Lachnospiraceae bacterium]|nr:MATE family efflux transporter [Lachnospiraceae bacterium]
MSEKTEQKDLLGLLHSREDMSIKDGMELILRLSLPAVMAQISTVVMEYIDASMVGRLGAGASASIGLVSSSTWLFGGIIGAITAGFTVQVAHRVGAKDEKGARQVTKYGLLFGFFTSLIVMAAAVSISRSLPVWMGGEEAIREDAFRYFLIYACTLPIHQLLNLSGGMIQCSGNIRLPSILNVAMCGLDVVFNALLIPVMGVAGAALGTSIAEGITMAVMLYFLLFRTPVLRFFGKEKIRALGPFVREQLPKAFRIGVPVGCENVIMGLAYVAFTRIVSPVGTVAVAANSFGITAEGLCYMPAYGVSIAATTIIGQSLGAARKDLARRFAYMTVALGMAFMAAAGFLMYLFAPQMMALLTPDESIRLLGTRILRIEAFAEPFFGASIVASGVFRGAGETLLSTVINLISTWCVRIPLALLLVGRYGLEGVWTAMCIELCIRGTFYLIRVSLWNRGKMGDD